MQGILRGFDPFMNLVLDEAMELASTGEHHNIGMVVCTSHLLLIIVSINFIDFDVIYHVLELCF